MPRVTATEPILLELGPSIEATTQYVLNKGHLSHFSLWRKALWQTKVTIHLCREKNSASLGQNNPTAWSDPRGFGERAKRARKALGLLRRWESKEEPKPKRGIPRWGPLNHLAGERIEDFLRLRRQIVTAAIRIDSRHQDTDYVAFNQGLENLLEPLDKARHTFTRLIKFVQQLSVRHGEGLSLPLPSAGNYQNCNRA